MMLKNQLKLFFQKINLIIVISFGVITWSWTMVKSGWIYDYGMGFWGANGHDGIWHIALAESISNGLLGNPVFAGETLKNYHLGFDMLLALVHILTGIPIVNLYFQVLPVIFAIMIGCLVYKFVFSWKQSENAALWSVFFTFFGGSLGWILGKGESAFWSQQALSTLINPPFVLSLIVILSGLIFLHGYLQEKTFKNYFLSVIFFTSLVQIKIYGAVIILGGLFIFSLIDIIQSKIAHKKIPTKLLDSVIHSRVLIVFVSTLTLSFLLFMTFTSKSANLIVWQPFWFLETMMGLSDRVGWERFFSAMTNYRTGGIWYKAIAAYGVAFLVFIVGNFGSRILFVFDYFRKKYSNQDIFLYSIIFTGIVIPMLFLQKGTPWNTIQFFYYSLFFSGILAGVSVNYLLSSLKLNTTLLCSIKVLLVILTIPTTVLTLRDVYIPTRPPAMVSNKELEALSFLSRQPQGIVLTYPFDRVAALNEELSPPRPLRLYVSTSYVAAFSKHPTYLEDEVNLDITGYDWKTRRDQLEFWYREVDSIIAKNFLAEKNIKYIYWNKGQRAILGESQLGITEIFNNSEVTIYRTSNI